MPKIVKKYGKITLILGLILVLIGMYVTILPTQASGTLPNRSVTISNSTPGAAGVDYAFKADFTASTIRCIEVVFSAAAVTNGMVTTSATQGADADWGGTPFTKATWADIENATPGTVRFWDATGEAGASAAIFGIGTITNPSALAYSAKINTYAPGSCTNAATCCTGTKTDEGTVMFAITAVVTVSATVAETLSVSIFDTAIGFGTLSTTQARYATADEAGSLSEPGSDLPTYISVTTNAASGVNISIADVGDGSTNAGLYKSASPTDLIEAKASSAVTDASGDGFGVYGKDAGSGLTIHEGFDNDGTDDAIIARTPLTFATSSGVLSSINVDISAKASVAGATKAGSYSDTLILITTPTY